MLRYYTSLLVLTTLLAACSTFNVEPKELLPAPQNGDLTPEPAQNAVRINTTLAENTPNVIVGIIYGTNNPPTTQNGGLLVPATGGTARLTNLNPTTFYNYRSCSQTAKGLVRYADAVGMFRVDDFKPVVETVITSTNQTAPTSATLTLRMINHGLLSTTAVTQSGIEFSSTATLVNSTSLTVNRAIATGTLASVSVANLTSGTRYFYRAYAINNWGGVGRSSVESFSTTAVAVKPTVSVGVEEDLKSTQVILSMTVLTAPTPLSRSGICFSKTSSNPQPDGAGVTTLFSTNTQPNGRQLYYLGHSGWGNSGSATPLEPGTRYYYRTFAESKVGTTTELGLGAQVREFTTLVNFQVPDMVFVAGGTFQMEDNNGDGDEKPVHQVRLNNFWIGKYEVTVKQYQDFCTATSRSLPGQWGGDNYPVVSVNWNDATAYCQWLSQKTGQLFRLPTEAEWEYAAKGGTPSQSLVYAGSNVAWYDNNNQPNGAKPVGTKSPNRLQLYDMSGNVWEWCNDWYSSSYYNTSPADNPKGPTTGTNRVYRGGSWYNSDHSCRISYRGLDEPTGQFSNYGFRVVRDN